MNVRKKLTVTIVNLRGKRTALKYRAASGHHFTDDGIDSLLTKIEEDIRKHSPKAEFRLVALRDGNFNIIEIAPPATMPETGTVEAVHA